MKMALSIEATSSTGMDRLRKLYIRDEVQTGYYERRNGREMITMKKPGYVGQNEALLSEIRKKYLSKERKCRAALYASFHTGEPACIRLEGEGLSLKEMGAAARNTAFDATSSAL